MLNGLIMKVRRKECYPLKSNRNAAEVTTKCNRHLLLRAIQPSTIVAYCISYLLVRDLQEHALSCCACQIDRRSNAESLLVFSLTSEIYSIKSSDPAARCYIEVVYTGSGRPCPRLAPLDDQMCSMSS